MKKCVGCAADAVAQKKEKKTYDEFVGNNTGRRGYSSMEHVRCFKQEMERVMGNDVSDRKSFTKV